MDGMGATLFEYTCFHFRDRPPHRVLVLFEIRQFDPILSIATLHGTWQQQTCLHCHTICIIMVFWCVQNASSFDILIMHVHGRNECHCSLVPRPAPPSLSPRSSYGQLARTKLSIQNAPGTPCISSILVHSIEPYA